MWHITCKVISRPKDVTPQRPVGLVVPVMTPSD